MSTRRSGTMVLASGGVESEVLLHRAAGGGGSALPVHVRQGFRWERVETLWLGHFGKPASRTRPGPRR